MFAVEGRNRRENQVIYCTTPQAQLTHPSSFIALLLHFFHYCYRLTFQYHWRGVTVPTEFTLWPYGESHFLTATSTPLHTLSLCLTVSLRSIFTHPSHLLPLFFSSSLELFCFSLKSSDNDLPWKHNTPIHTSLKLLQGVICRIRKGCFAANVYSVFFYSGVIF